MSLLKATTSLSKIGFDFDGVIADSLPAKIKLGRRLGFSITPDQTTSNILQKITGKSNYKNLVYLLYRKETLKFKPCEGIKTLIKKLKTHGCSLVIISARGKEESLFAQKWLKKQGLINFFDEIIFCAKQDKPKIIKKYKLDVYIDDSAETLNPCPKNVIKVLYDHYQISGLNCKRKKYLIIKDFKEIL